MGSSLTLTIANCYMFFYEQNVNLILNHNLWSMLNLTNANLLIKGHYAFESFQIMSFLFK